jgi:hypothetical protein
MPDFDFVQRLVSALRPVPPSARKLIHHAVDRSGPNSVAARLCSDEERFSVGMLQPYPISEALRNLALYMRAGTEHLQAVKSLLQGPLDLGTSLATVVRASTEAHGRAYFFLEDPSVYSMLAGFIRLQRSSENYLRLQMKLTPEWKRKSDARLKEYTDTAGLLAIKPADIAFIKPATHSIAMINALTPNGMTPHGQWYYSMLSSQAHHELSGWASQRIGVEQSTTKMPFKEVFGLHPFELSQVLTPLVVSHRHVMELFLDLHDVEQGPREPWRHANQNLMQLLAEFESAGINEYSDSSPPEDIEFPHDVIRQYLYNPDTYDEV